MPETKANAAARVVNLAINSIRDGDKNPFSLQRAFAEACGLLHLGGEQAMQGHMMLAVLHAYDGNRVAFLEHFRVLQEHRYRDGLIHAAMCASLVGLPEISADVLSNLQVDELTDIRLLRDIAQASSYTCQFKIYAATIARLDHLQRSDLVSDHYRIILQRIERLRACREFTDSAILQRLSVAADIAFREGGCTLGSSCSVNHAGISFQFWMPHSISRLVEIDEAIANGIVESFDDPMDWIVTFSTKPTPLGLEPSEVA